VESSAACGLYLVPQSQRDPLHTTAYGVGQLLRAAFEAGHTTVVLGLGGSATNEAGLSVLQGLGCDLVLANGRSRGAEDAFSGARLEEVVEVRAPESDPIVHQMLSTMRLDLACDVDNPFLGSRGAVETFSAQKGSTPQSRRQLERGMEHVSGVLEAQTGRVVGSLRGAGAAGGMCGGLAAMFTHARIMSGVRVVAEHLGLEKMVRGADAVVTGEGAFDAQSLQGKVVGHVVGLCHQVGVPVYVLCGRVDRASIMSHQLEDHELRMDAQWLVTHVAALVDYVPLDMALHNTSGALQITTRQFLLPIFSHQRSSSIRPPS
jgi:glycerate kinase